MASTKQKQAEARARRNADKSQFRINEYKLTELLLKTTNALIASCPNQDYTSTPEMTYAAQAIVESQRLNATDFQQLLTYRVTMDRALKTVYGYALPNDMSAMMIDPEEMLKQHNIPQSMRVTIGLLDMVIGRLAFSMGAIKFN